MSQQLLDHLNNFKPAQKSVPGSYATGKGTTARIKQAYKECSCYTARELGDFLNLPARQLNKRLAELVKSGFLRKEPLGNGRTDYISTTI